MSTGVGVVLMVVGMLVGAAIAVALLRRERAAAPEPPVRSRAQSLSPITAFLGADGADARSFLDQRFAALRDDMLRDAMLAQGAIAAAVWRFTADGLKRDFVVGDRAAVDDLYPALAPLLEWTTREGIPQLGPDGDAPRAVVARLGGTEGHRLGAVALVFRDVVRTERSVLKQAATLCAERLGVVSELVRNHEELAKSNKRTRALLRAAEHWDVEERPVDLGVNLCAAIEQLTGADGAAVVQWDERQRTGSVVVADGSCAPFAGSGVDEDSLVGTACRENVPQLWHEVGGSGGGRADVSGVVFSRALPAHAGCVIVHPLRRRGGVIGAVVASHTRPGALGPSELRALALLDAVASFRLASAWKLEELSRRVVIDGLTGLRNRDGFDAEMREALGEQMRFGWEVSLVLVDVDRFKRVNDTYGHSVGDDVLRMVASILQDGVRTTDVCARVGGDEMALILKDTGSAGARELADRLRAAIAAARVPAGAHQVGVTASFGIATYPTEVPDWDALYRRADSAMYAAKSAGRDEASNDPV